jgi:alkylation response protein AidB-like acyl-CoA dehydrogenase
VILDLPRQVQETVFRGESIKKPPYERRRAMWIQFTEEQIALRDLARDFFEREVRPVMAEIDARPDPKDCYPKDLVRRASEIGLRTLNLPETYGGVDADVITRALVLSTMCE